MLRGREESTGLFVCAYREQVAGTVHKLVHAKRTLVHVVTGTVCKCSAHPGDVTSKTEDFLCLLHDVQIQTQLNFMQYVAGT